MSEVLKYQKELDFLKSNFKEDYSVNKIRKIYEYIKSVNNSNLPIEYKETFIKAAKNEIPIENFQKLFEDEKNELNPLLYTTGVIGGNFFYDILKNFFHSLLDEVKKVEEKGVEFG